MKKTHSIGWGPRPIAAKLDADIHATQCRLVLHGRIVHAVEGEQWKEILVIKDKCKEAQVSVCERMGLWERGQHCSPMPMAMLKMDVGSVVVDLLFDSHGVRILHAVVFLRFSWKMFVDFLLGTLCMGILQSVADGQPVKKKCPLNQFEEPGAYFRGVGKCMPHRVRYP